MSKDFQSLINSDKPVLVDFYADWCEPCQWLNPILDDVEKIISGKAGIHKFDIEQHHELKAEYNIMSVPVLMIFKNGQLLWRMNGFMYAPELSKKVLSFI